MLFPKPCLFPKKIDEERVKLLFRCSFRCIIKLLFGWNCWSDQGKTWLQGWLSQLLEKMNNIKRYLSTVVPLIKNSYFKSGRTTTLKWLYYLGMVVHVNAALSFKYFCFVIFQVKVAASLLLESKMFYVPFLLNSSIDWDQLF